MVYKGIRASVPVKVRQPLMITTNTPLGPFKMIMERKNRSGEKHLLILILIRPFCPVKRFDAQKKFFKIKMYAP